jgi:hypothetical protein
MKVRILKEQKLNGATRCDVTGLMKKLFGASRCDSCSKLDHGLGVIAPPIHSGLFNSEIDDDDSMNGAFDGITVHRHVALASDHGNWVKC